MGLDFNRLSPEELLAAESAVLTMRSLMDAAKAAPHGKGMACVETALHDKGFEHLLYVGRRGGVPRRGRAKRGLQFALFLAGKEPPSNAANKRRC